MVAECQKGSRCNMTGLSNSCSFYSMYIFQVAFHPCNASWQSCLSPQLKRQLVALSRTENNIPCVSLLVPQTATTSTLQQLQPTSGFHTKNQKCVTIAVGIHFKAQGAPAEGSMRLSNHLEDWHFPQLLFMAVTQSWRPQCGLHPAPAPTYRGTKSPG